jgi:GTPase SAR1 family protein
MALTLQYSGILEFGFPQIVVVGSQSVGKSSIIERTFGVRLDRSVQTPSHILW